ncbi:MAG TPA: gliding motility-associated C-terminal domain-containing protein, partial [Taishania sp.]|nr:gliding motility-associated C-terminal domain-containing protein [Taishania sp.]
LSAQPFCTGMTDVTYCNAYAGNNGPSLEQYACLYTTPNSMWMYMEIAEEGNIIIDLTQHNMNGSGIDVDFAIYGPYTSLAQGCSTIGPNTTPVDCSYSASYQEEVNVNNVQPGQIYVMLVTNYNGSEGTYSPNDGGSTGATNCDILFPCSATVTSTPDECGLGVGTATVTPVGIEPPYTISWDLPGNPSTETVTDLVAGTYTVTVNSPECESPAVATVTVGNIAPTFTSTSTPASCSTGNNGTATATYPGSPSGTTVPIESFSWNDPLNQTTATATGLAPGTYTCTITLENGCVGSTTVTVGFGTINSSSQMTQVSCPGGNDGTATAQVTPVVGTLSYQWNDPNAQTTATATGLAAGTYTCVVTNSVGCSNNVTVTVTEVPGLNASVNSFSNVTCNSKNDGVINIATSGGTAPYTYQWSQSSSTSNSANDLFAGTHTIVVTDSKNCSVTLTHEITEPDPLAINVITPNTQICPEDSILLTGAGIGGSSEYIYTWKQGNTVISNTNSVMVDPEFTNTVYCLELREVCGSPMTDSCVIITFPEPITPQVFAPYYVDCVPGEFTLSNVSPNVGEVLTTYYDFGNNTNAIVNNGEDVTIVYNVPGVYDVTMINTSIYGCAYEAFFPGLLTVTPLPTANFYIAPNPTTIFETNVSAQNMSSSDVVQWDWYSPYSTPSYSNLTNPKLNFPEGVEGTYPVTLIVTSQEGCVDTMTLDVIVEDAIVLYAPNTFTPDGDEFNQTWKIFVKGGDIYGGFSLQIYNRWGEMIWESHDPNIGWDGTYNGQIVQSGTYSWRASLKNKNDDGKNEFSGFINVIK